MTIRLLAIDDEVAHLHNLREYLEAVPGQFEVTLAETGEEGVLQLAARSFDVLLTDINLPGIDGTEVVRRAQTLAPYLKVVVMTGFGTPELRTWAHGAGVVQFVDKPLELAELRRILTETTQAHHGWQGTVGGLDIFDFAQLLILSGKSKVIEVRCGRDEGIVVFDSGAMVHASTADRRGEAAFHQMVEWEGGSFAEVLGVEASHYPPNITCSGTRLMMETARRRDERRAAIDESEDVHMAIRELLGEFQGVKGVRGAALLSPEGAVLEQVTSADVDMKANGDLARRVVTSLREIVATCDGSEPNLVQIRTAASTLLIRSFASAASPPRYREVSAAPPIVVVLDPKGNIGMAMVIVDRIIERLARELE